MMRFDGRHFGLASMLIAQALWCAPAEAAGALAVGVAPGGAQMGFAYGMNANKPDADQAKTDAVGACGKAKESNAKARSRCMPIGTYTDQCASVAMDPKDGTPGAGWAISADSTTANELALASCEATAGPGRAGTCKVSATRCDGNAK